MQAQPRSTRAKNIDQDMRRWRYMITAVKIRSDILRIEKVLEFYGYYTAPNPTPDTAR